MGASQRGGDLPSTMRLLASLRLRSLAASLPGDLMLHDPPLQGMSGEAQKFSCVDDVACRRKCFEAELPFRGGEIVGLQVDRDVHG